MGQKRDTYYITDETAPQAPMGAHMEQDTGLPVRAKIRVSGPDR